MAASLLVRAPRTEADLHARLVAKGYQVETADRTLARAKELGWVGDERYADERARSLRARGHGALRIAADLEARGLPEGLIEAVVDASRDGASERDLAHGVLTREGIADPRGSAKAWRLLATRGFPEDVVSDVVGEVMD